MAVPSLGTGIQSFRASTHLSSSKPWRPAHLISSGPNSETFVEMIVAEIFVERQQSGVVVSHDHLHCLPSEALGQVI